MIKIRRSITADTRATDRMPTRQELYDSSVQHISDVCQAIDFMIDKLKRIKERHDFTKLTEIDSFYEDFKSALKKKEFNFSKGKWYQKHIKEERHHLDQRVPEDVNLFDVLERIADIVMAGLGRSGKVYEDRLDPEILSQAYKNTIEFLINNTEVLEDTPSLKVVFKRNKN